MKPIAFLIIISFSAFHLYSFEKTELPKKKSFYSINLPEPFEVAVLFDEPFLPGKEIKSISIYLTKEYANNNYYSMFLYTIGKDGYPDKLLNEGGANFRKFKNGWNTYGLDLSKYKIPYNGVIIGLRFVNETYTKKPHISIVGIGKYSNPKIYYLRILGKKENRNINSFAIQKDFIAPMVQIQVSE